MLFGIIVLLLGVVFLLQNLGVLTASVWAIFWPALLILFGLSVMFRRKHCWWCGSFHKHNHEDWHKFGEEMRERFGHRHEEEKKEGEQK